MFFCPTYSGASLPLLVYFGVRSVPRLLPYFYCVFTPLKVVTVALKGTPMLVGAVHMMSTFSGQNKHRRASAGRTGHENNIGTMYSGVPGIYLVHVMFWL